MRTGSDRWATAGLLALSILVLGSGYGVHEPWPPDSPRFVAVARDMLATGDWLFPRVGGDLYANKPPVFFWLMATAIWLTGSVRAGYLLPSLLAGLGTVWLTFDLARRLWDTRIGILAGVALLATIQFTLQAHTAQIDGVLCFLTTLGLYGLLRHLLQGPEVFWYVIGGAACGLGVVTKGVGFLPLLVVLPWALLRRRGALPGPRVSALEWALAPFAALFVIALWLVPMVLASLDDPALAAYRNEILFGQTVDRYVEAEGHRKPAWYLLTKVIPWAWLPLSLALPWLAPHWRDAWRKGDARVMLPLLWAGLVVLFFSLSSGKRGVYLLPALPAVIIAAAPFVETLLRRRWLNYLALSVMASFALAAAYAYVELPAELAERIGEADPAMAARLQWAAATIAVLGVVSLVPWHRRMPGLARLAVFLAGCWLLAGWRVMPVLDDIRSGAPVMAAARRASPAGTRLGITRPKESPILHAGGPLTNFGHCRPDTDQELADAASWLQADATRRLIVPSEALDPCFSGAEPLDLGLAHRRHWYLVTSAAVSSECAHAGRAQGAIDYAAPGELPSLAGSLLIPRDRQESWLRADGVKVIGRQQGKSP